jgi:hypothetical protein
MRHVDDAEPPVAKGDALFDEEAGAIRPPMMQDVPHPLDERSVDPSG